MTAGLRSGWVFNRAYGTSRVAVSIAQQDREYYRAFRPFLLKLRDTPSARSGGQTVNIKTNETLAADYSVVADGETYYYGTFGEQSGWYGAEDANDSAAYKMNVWDYSSGINTKNRSDSAVPIFADIEQQSKTVGKIPAGSTYTPLYYGHYETEIDDENTENTWFYYVQYNGVSGWVLEEDLNVYDAEAEEDEEPEEDETPEDTTADSEAQPEDETEEAVTQAAVTTTTAKSSLGAMQIVLLCVGGAAILALTAVVTLLLIRRKRRV